MFVTVMFAPLTRLAGTRVAVSAQIRRDMEEWRTWAAGVFVDGAGMLIATDPGYGPEVLSEALTEARRVARRGLVGAAESDRADEARQWPDYSQVPHEWFDALPDVGYLRCLDHLPLWKGRLAGLSASTVDEVEAVGTSTAAYVVVDWHLDEPWAKALTIPATRPDFFVFASGIDNSQDLSDAVAKGARRIWIDESVDCIRAWSDRLRLVWKSDPAMQVMRGMNLAARRVL